LRCLGSPLGSFRIDAPVFPPSSYMGELPNSHGRTLTDKSYVLHGIPYKVSGDGNPENY
jgi:hypothetical protein